MAKDGKIRLLFKINMKKRVLALTGIRSEYDIMSSVFKSISDHPDLELNVVVTEIGRAHVRTPVTSLSRMPSSA